MKKYQSRLQKVKLICHFNIEYDRTKENPPSRPHSPNNKRPQNKAIKKTAVNIKYFFLECKQILQFFNKKTIISHKSIYLSAV